MSGAVSGLKRLPGVRATLHFKHDVGQVLRQHRQLATYGIGYYNWWAQGSTAQSWFYRFLQRPALRERVPGRRVGFFSVFGRRRVIRMTPCDRRVFFTGEALSHYPAYHDHLLQHVDLALGYAELTHPRYLRFPIWLLECFDPQATLSDIQHQLHQHHPGPLHAGAEQRKNSAVLVARHDRGGVRAQLSDLVATLGQVTYGGAFRGNISPPLAAGWPAKRALLEQYRFTICPENTNEPGYVTEKLFQALAAGCIPLYWGGGGRPEPEILNQEAILFFDPAHPQRLMERLTPLVQDETAYRTMRAKHPYREGAAEHIYGYYQRLEDRLQNLLL